MTKLLSKVVPVTKEEFLNLRYGDRILVDPGRSLSLQPMHWGIFNHFHKSGMALYFQEGFPRDNMYGCSQKEVLKIEKTLT